MPASAKASSACFVADAIGWFALSTSFTWALAALFGAGFAASIYLNLGMTTLQTLVPDELRGRVMSLFTLTFFGGMPLGALLAGAAAERIGEPATVFANAAIVLAASLVIWLRLPFIRKLG